MFTLNLNTTTTSQPYSLQKSRPTHQRKPQMALNIHLLPLKPFSQTLKFGTYPFSSKAKIQISCTNGVSDAELALNLATEVEKINTHLVQRKEAMRKSRHILFAELCEHMGLKTEEVKKKWKRMNEDDKWVLAKGFVSEWGVNFHPLSARSVKEMVEEFLVEDNPSINSSPSLFFPNLKNMMGLSQTDDE